jgi:Xaa-Pro aminopeptidase
MAIDRLHRLHDAVIDHDLDALLLYKPVNSYYASGFTSLDTARPTSYTRPIVAVLTRSAATLVVPLLDDEPAREMSWIRDVRSYIKAPPFESAQEVITDFLQSQGVGRGRIGVEEDYLSLRVEADLKRRLPGMTLVPAAAIVEQQRLIKDAEEIAHIREASRLTDVAMTASMEAMTAGRSEIEVEAEGIRAIRLPSGAGESNGHGDAAMIDAMAIIIGGARGSMPHEFSSYRRYAEGDLTWHCWLISSHGYWAENVRSVVLGKASDTQRHMIGTAREALEIGKEKVRPGNEVGDVFAAVHAHLKAGAPEDAMVISRSGHGSGLEYHEPPFVEITDRTVLRPGMVLTIEPGIFLPGVGGATFSDTVVVTEDGNVTLTRYPIATEV